MFIFGCNVTGDFFSVRYYFISFSRDPLNAMFPLPDRHWEHFMQARRTSPYYVVLSSIMSLLGRELAHELIWAHDLIFLYVARDRFKFFSPGAAVL